MENKKQAWQDPENIGSHVLKPRTHRFNYEPLDGPWSFCHLAMDEQQSEILYHKALSQGTWTSVTVPHTFESEHVTTQAKTIGFYRYHCQLTLEDQESYYLHLGAVSPACYVWVNGQAVGYGVNDAIPTEFLISSFVRTGDNDIVIGVIDGFAGHTLASKTQQKLVGLLGKVRLGVEPHVHIYDYFAKFKLENQGLFSLEVDVCNHGAKQAPIQILVTLYDWEKQPVHVLKGNVVLPAGTSKTMVLTDALEDVFLWSAETPYLYDVVMTLKTPEGYVIENKQFQYGFRAIEFDKGVLTVNHQPIKLQGVNYTIAYDTATVETRIAQYEADLIQMKRCHINAIKLVGLPFESEFYQLCDRMGFYVLDEAQVYLMDQKGSKPILDDPKWTKAIIHNVMGMIERDKNHPCVLVWCLGQGMGMGENSFVTKKIASGRDYSRPYCSLEGTGDVLGLQFPNLDLIQTIGEDPLPEKPVLLLAYAPASGNGMGDLDRYQALITTYGHLAGGFIWNYDGLFEKNQRQHPAALEVQKVFQPIHMTCVSVQEHRYEIRNGYYFKTIKGLRLDWTLLEDGVSIATGEVGELNLEPGERQQFTLSVGAFDAIEGAEYHVNLLVHQVDLSPYFEAGQVVAYEQFALPKKQLKKIEKMGSGSVQVYDKKIKVEIIGEGFLVRLSKLTGDLTSIMYDHQEYLLAPLKLNFTREKTDHDLTDQPVLHQRWEKAQASYSVKKVIIEDMQEQVIITLYRKVKGMRGLVKTNYTINSSGHILVEVMLTPKYAPIRIGTTFEMADKYHQVAWYGKGRHEHYQDRNTSALVGVYECTLDTFVHHYMRPQENANRTDIRWVTLSTDEGEGLMFEGMQEKLLNFSARPSAQNVTVNVDLGQQGVGKHDPNAKQADHLLSANQTYTFGFTISKVY